MTDARFSRRKFLGAACCAAASPAITTISFAATPGENRLVVIILRGGMDGLAVAQPWGDPALAALRPDLAARPDAGLTDLDGFFGLHDGLAALAPLWRDGDLGFAHAVATPYRDKRSHFDGQDFLENGGADRGGALTPGRDGWLNRALALIPGAEPQFAVAVGRDNMLLLDGAEPAASWAPQTNVSLGADERGLLQMLYARDPLFLAAAEQAIALDAVDGGMGGGDGAEPARLAAFAADMLSGSSRIAAFSIGGWDTHRGQAGALRRPLRMLAEAILALKSGLGRHWERTAVIAMTEFGRTARQNGTRGTDHGTGGAALLAGGAVRGGRVYGRWPRLGDGDLYQDRDLLPTGDVRDYPAELLAGLFGAPQAGLARTVFPGLEAGARPGVLA